MINKKKKDPVYRKKLLRLELQRISLDFN